mgnify:FL=1
MLKYLWIDFVLQLCINLNDLKSTFAGECGSILRSKRYYFVLDFSLGMPWIFDTSGFGTIAGPLSSWWDGSSKARQPIDDSGEGNNQC